MSIIQNFGALTWLLPYYPFCVSSFVHPGPGRIHDTDVSNTKPRFTIQIIKRWSKGLHRYQSLAESMDVESFSNYSNLKLNWRNPWNRNYLTIWFMMVDNLTAISLLLMTNFCTESINFLCCTFFEIRTRQENDTSMHRSPLLSSLSSWTISCTLLSSMVLSDLICCRGKNSKLYREKTDVRL